MLGLAFSGAVGNFVHRHRDIVDFVEIPYELLNHDPRVVEIREKTLILLHCASLSIAGTSPCSGETISKIQYWLKQTRSPWLGEHLAFITADRLEANSESEVYAPGEPYNIGYTVSPPMNDCVAKRVADKLAAYQPLFPVPLLIENSPLYFRTPGSTMSQVEFINTILQRTQAGLLLDLAHFCISSMTMDFDPLREVQRLPLERVVEIHISGVSVDPDGAWDDHARSAPAVVHELLKLVLTLSKPRAVTLEYNWSSRISDAVLITELAKARDAIESTSSVG